MEKMPSAGMTISDIKKIDWEKYRCRECLLFKEFQCIAKIEDDRIVGCFDGFSKTEEHREIVLDRRRRMAHAQDKRFKKEDWGDKWKDW